MTAPLHKNNVVYVPALAFVEVARGITRHGRASGFVGNEYEDDVLVAVEVGSLISSFVASDYVIANIERITYRSVIETIFGYAQDYLDRYPLQDTDRWKYTPSSVLRCAIDLDLHFGTNWASHYRLTAKALAISVIGIDDDLDRLEFYDLNQFDQMMCDAMGAIAAHDRLAVNPPSEFQRNDTILLDRTMGIVKWYNADKGYGFILGEGTEDVFVHAAYVRGGGPLDDGQLVEYSVARGEHGLQALDVLRK